MSGGSARVAVAAGIVVVLASHPVAAQTETEPGDRFTATTIELRPLDGSEVVIGDRRYAGSMTVTAHGAGLALVEETSVEDYVLGIREVPFAWPQEALAAQAVAARTYLAWYLERGRSSNGRRFGYDICATTACQVYAGVGGLDSPEGERWREAVGRTAGLVLLAADGSAVQALYSSTSDGRTRNVEDVFPGATPDPNLRAVESPGEASPFVAWEFVLTREQAAAMFDHAGLVEGELVDVSSDRTADGEGAWTVTVHSTDGLATVDTWTLRTWLNRAAAELFPDHFPAFRPGSARRYPQTIMSPNYTVTSEYVFVPPVDGPPRLERRFRVRGGGWGHLVGMSQFGAEAMASTGADHAAILSHYYGGAVPTTLPTLPDRVRVGLDTELEDMVVEPDGPMRVVVDGVELTAGELGTWAIVWDGDVAVVDPPDGLGLPPDVFGVRVFFDTTGAVELVTFRSRTAAELRIVVRAGDVILSDSDWQVRDPGVVAVDVPLSTTALTIDVFARSTLGDDSLTLRILPGAE